MQKLPGGWKVCESYLSSASNEIPNLGFGPNWDQAHKTQISVALCFRTRKGVMRYATLYSFHKFLKCKRCEFGARCQFAHGQLELRTLAQNYLQLNPQVPFKNT